MRHLIDTCVALSALHFRQGASNALMQQVLERRLPIVLHMPAEYRDVLLRDAHRLATGLSEDRVHRFLAALVGVADEVFVRYLWRPNLRDENDNFVIEIAVAASPCTIVTNNVRYFSSNERLFAGVRIARPVEVLKPGAHNA